MTRIGIFLCTCDGELDRHIQVDAIQYGLRTHPDLALLTTLPHACLPDGERALRAAIAENKLERVVVAACPARFQEKHLRGVCLDAGVNVNHFALVDWREGCAWAHRGDRQAATRKAIDLLQMGAARVAHAPAVDGTPAAIIPRVLVIGGGSAGLTAARALAERGLDVTLVEREPELGGRLRAAPRDGGGAAFEAARQEALSNPRLEVLLNARLTAVTGSVGDYHVTVTGPAGSSPREIEAGAIIVATGAQEYRDPRLYRYDGRRVVTLGEFATEISERSADPASFAPALATAASAVQAGQNPKSAIQNRQSKIQNSVVFLLCAGSRTEQVPYCSNVCCLGALDQALRVKRADPNARVTVLWRDLYLLGDEANDDVVREARRAGVEFVRYGPEHPPRVDEDFITVREPESERTHCLAYDRLVLATPLVPRDDAGVLARLLKLSRDEAGFFVDPRPRVRPEQQAERGIFVCGSAHRPVDADTAVQQGLTAAARAARWIRRREAPRPPWSAAVNPQVCTGCAQCLETCAFGAIEMSPASRVDHGALDRAVIDPFLCLACGNCAAACPAKAIDLPNARDAQIFAQIEAALAARPEREPVLLVFGCQWSGVAAMELAGARGLTYSPQVRVIELPCSARLDPLHVLYAFLNGADKVLLALCPPDECHFGHGNRFAEARVEALRAPLAANGIDPRRLVVTRLLGDDAGAWVRAVKDARPETRPGRGS